ncbi:tRNA 2-thiouridine synthesizing protein A [Thiogranum longum]|uniref:tRNA 2-thiouridine synthesizing protein A n=1 Tax=Thiogranum longum TaxID=1537524 RepID=A0A4R1H9R2_9GAMM|nr:sulfurtransferase TusA family protein [Thiogranum longum]TCK16885.1 tRNA 2-thiouridine synthesizing protein A [Thiogranum longum]
MSHYELDVRRMLCPMPVIRSQDRIEHLQPGDTLAVICTDPGAKHDIPAWCRVNGHEVLSIDEKQDELVITVRVGNKD